MQRCGAGGAVDGDAPLVDGGVEGAAGGDEGGEVGDGVVDEEALAVLLEVDGLVEVAGAGRVDGDEGQVARVRQGRQRAPGGLLRLGQRRGREVDGDLELGAELVEGLRDARGRGRQVELAGAHAALSPGHGGAGIGGRRRAHR